jgi:uncharacterized DUF497 family protein
MRIDFIVCPEHIDEKLRAKHHVTCHEARQVLLSRPRIRFAEKGYTEGEDVYAAFGQTPVFFIYKQTLKTAVIISSRDMSDKERNAYGRK